VVLPWCLVGFRGRHLGSPLVLVVSVWQHLGSFRVFSGVCVAVPGFIPGV
jgi:hypothetical protein